MLLRMHATVQYLLINNELINAAQMHNRSSAIPCTEQHTVCCMTHHISPAAAPSSSWASYKSLRSLHADVLLRTAKLCTICGRIFTCAVKHNLRAWLLTHSSKAFSLEMHQPAQPCGSRI